jgi:predicted outer membrane protein
MKFTRIGISIGAAAMFCAVAVAGANEEKQKLSDAELQIMAKLHHANKMEIDMGKLAAQQAKSAEVKSYAERVVKDHQGGRKAGGPGQEAGSLDPDTGAQERRREEADG